MNIDTGQKPLFATIQGSVNPRDFVVTPSGSLLINDFTNLYKLRSGATQADSLGFSGGVSHMPVVPVPEPATLTPAVLTARLLVARRRDLRYYEPPDSFSMAPAPYDCVVY